MKKFLSLIAAVVAVFTFAACGGDEATGGKLSTPRIKSVRATEAGDGFTVTWDAVKGATDYVVMLQGTTKNYTTKETSYTVTGLTYGTYTPMVKAVGAGYDDSDYAKGMPVQVQGVANVDWFSIELSLPENTDEFANKGINSSNTILATLKGEGITDIYYAWFLTEGVETATRDQIVNNLQALPAESVEEWLAGINSADGLTLEFPAMFYGSGDFTLFVLAYQDQAEFLASASIVTDANMPTTATQTWLGTWSAYATQTVYFGETEDGQSDIQINTKMTEFELTITPHEYYSDLVYVDGYTAYGEGLPVIGYTGYAEDGSHLLYIENTQQLTDVNQYGYAIFLLTYASIGGEFQFTALQVYPVMLFADADGSNFGAELLEGTFEDGTTFEAHGADAIYWNTTDGSLGFIELQDGKVLDEFKYGDITLVGKTAGYTPAPKALSVAPATKVVPTSMVLAL